MEACPGKVVAETEDEVWKLMELHAKIAHDENANEWDDETQAYLKTLIKTV
jgi:predicted small metal-binding protein